MYLIWEIVGSEPPCQKGSWRGLPVHNSLCFEFTQKRNELCFVNTCMLTLYCSQAAWSKPPGKVGFQGLDTPCTANISHANRSQIWCLCPFWDAQHCVRYVVHGTWYEVWGARYEVHGARYKVRVYEVLNTLYDFWVPMRHGIPTYGNYLLLNQLNSLKGWVANWWAWPLVLKQMHAWMKQNFYFLNSKALFIWGSPPNRNINIVQHRPEQNRVTWETPSSVAIPLLQEPIGVLASYATVPLVSLCSTCQREKV